MRERYVKRSFLQWILHIFATHHRARSARVFLMPLKKNPATAYNSFVLYEGYVAHVSICEWWRSRNSILDSLLHDSFERKGTRWGGFASTRQLNSGFRECNSPDLAVRCS